MSKIPWRYRSICRLLCMFGKHTAWIYIDMKWTCVHCKSTKMVAKQKLTKS